MFDTVQTDTSVTDCGGYCDCRDCGDCCDCDRASCTERWIGDSNKWLRGMLCRGLDQRTQASMFCKNHRNDRLKHWHNLLRHDCGLYCTASCSSRTMIANEMSPS